MDSTFSLTAVPLLAALAGIGYLFYNFSSPRLFPNEPPLISSSIPYIGHVLGLLRYGTKYYQITRYSEKSLS